MFCSGCGLVLAAGQGFCPQCGRPAAVPIAPMPDLAFQVETYAGKIKALGVVWLIYAGLGLFTGIASLTFAQAFFANGFGPFGHGRWGGGSMAPFWLGPAFLHFVWGIVLLRAALALAAGWGLVERAPWARVVAIVAAVLGLIRFPFGTAIGIWTLVVLLGYRNQTLYEQL